MNSFEVFNETEEEIDLKEVEKFLDFALKHENLNDVIFNIRE